MKKTISREFIDLFKLKFIWLKLAHLDILKRYRRSLLGPFWITISTLVTTTALSTIYSKVLNVEIAEYFPYLTIGLIYWNFVSTLLQESCDTFVESERIIKQENFSFIIYIMRVVTRNFIILIHNLFILSIVFYIIGLPSIYNLGLFFISIILILICSIPICFIIAIISLRYRDIPPIISSLLQLSFFATPILFKKELLNEYSFILFFNPFYYFLEIFRSPLIGVNISINYYLLCFFISLFLWVMFCLIYNRSKNRIPFWL
jgi:lipopolysaccharide transport system permease protein